MSETKNIGLNVRAPDKSCTDRNCPFHGTVKLRGKLLTGRAASVSAKNLAVVERESFQYNTKYMRYLKKRSKLHAHLPPCLEVSIGDIVSVAECRPLAKTVSFVVVENVSVQERTPVSGA
jgi:small subunit ribosomal protein S17